MRAQIGTAFGQLGKPDTAVIVGTGGARHVEFRIVEIEVRAFIALFGRHAFKLAVEVEGPRVIGAVKIIAGITLARRTQLRASMGAAIVKNVNFAILVFDHHHRLTADLGEIVIARFFYLAFMSNIDPRVFKNSFHFEIENLGVGIGFTVRAVWFDHCANLFSGPAHVSLPVGRGGLLDRGVPDQAPVGESVAV